LRAIEKEILSRAGKDAVKKPNCFYAFHYGVPQKKAD